MISGSEENALPDAKSLRPIGTQTFQKDRESFLERVTAGAFGGRPTSAHPCRNRLARRRRHRAAFSSTGGSAAILQAGFRPTLASTGTNIGQALGAEPAFAAGLLWSIGGVSQQLTQFVLEVQYPLLDIGRHS